MSGVRASALGLAFMLMAGCNDMETQPKQQVYGPQAPAQVPDHIVEYASEPVEPPPTLTQTLLERGQERYRIYCTPCHSELGDGHGIVVQRGFPAPPSFHIDRLREASPQYFYDVITQGHGVMYSFADKVRPIDRWAIAAYIRALQRSQHATLVDVSGAERSHLP